MSKIINLDFSDLAIIILLLGLSAFFSAAETALVSISPAKVRHLYESKKYGSHYLKKIKDRQNQTLIVILLWNNFLNIFASVYTTVLITDKFGSVGIGITTGLMTLLILLFGEVIPKSFGTAHTQGISLWSAPTIYFLGQMIRPVIWLFDGIVKAFFRLFGIKKEKLVTDEELIALVSIGQEEGSLQENEKELIENVLEFNDIRVEEIMTPRVHIDAVPEDYNLNEAAEFMLNHSHTRIPVYRDTIDNIVGIVTYKEILQEVKGDGDMHKTLRQIDLRTPLKVAHSTMIHWLFKTLNSKRTQMAIVLDEHGGTGGLVTMEDLIEELVGEIVDESDIEEDMYKQISDQEYELSGRLSLETLEKISGLKLEYPGYKTVNYLIIEKLGHLPGKGKKVQIENWEFTVAQVHRHTIIKVNMRLLKS